VKLIHREFPVGVATDQEIELGEVGHNGGNPTIPAKAEGYLAVQVYLLALEAALRTRKEGMKKKEGMKEDECETGAEVDCHCRAAERAIAGRVGSARRLS